MAKSTSTAPKKQVNTTVAIDPQTTERLNMFCQKCGITKKDFISMSLDFFEQTGLTPQDTDKVMSTRMIERQMEAFGSRLEAIDKRTEQSNTTISNVHGMVMGQVTNSIKALLEDVVLEREATKQLVLEAHEERVKVEELQNQKKKKRGWFRKKEK